MSGFTVRNNREKEKANTAHNTLHSETVTGLSSTFWKQNKIIWGPEGYGGLHFVRKSFASNFARFSLQLPTSFSLCSEGRALPSLCSVCILETLPALAPGDLSQLSAHSPGKLPGMGDGWEKPRGDHQDDSSNIEETVFGFPLQPQVCFTLVNKKKPVYFPGRKRR